MPISVSDFIIFTNTCLKTFRHLWDTFSIAGEIEWREMATLKINEANLGADDIFNLLTKIKLETLIS